MPQTVGHSRSTRATRGFSPARGEPRPVHITWIATCRVYNSVIVIRRIAPGLSPGYENPTVDQSIVHSVLRDLGGGCRALQPAQKHRGIKDQLGSLMQNYQPEPEPQAAMSLRLPVSPTLSSPVRRQ